jgi:hypothetical protein
LISPFSDSSRQELYAARDQSSLTRSEFFQSVMPRGVETADIRGVEIG